MAYASQASAVAATPRGRGSREAGLAIAWMIFILVIFGLLYPRCATGALRVWIASPTFNHCFLVLPISVFLVWHRRSLLAGMIAKPIFWAAVPIAVLSIAWLFVSIAGLLEGEQLIVMTMVQAALFGLLGKNYYRKLAAPFLYLYFLVPTGQFLVPALQTFTARFAVAGLHALGIPVFSDGALIEIPAGSFAVAEACAGLRFLIASVAFGVLFAVLTYRSLVRRTVFIAVSIVVPILANGIRALGLIAAAQWLGSPTAALADHLIYGWLFFSLVLVLLIFIGQRFSDRAPQAMRAEDDRTNVYYLPAPRLNLSSIGVSAACFIAAATAPLAAYWAPKSPELPVPSYGWPVAHSWSEIPPPGDWKPIVVSPKKSFLQSFGVGQFRVDRFVALYDAPRRAGNLANSANRDADEREWSFDTARREQLALDGRLVSVRASAWVNGSRRRTIWSFYDIGNEIVADTASAKWKQFEAYLTNKPCLSAYVALSTEGADNGVDGDAIRILASASAPLSRYLCAGYQSPAMSRANRK